SKNDGVKLLECISNNPFKPAILPILDTDEVKLKDRIWKNSLSTPFGLFFCLFLAFMLTILFLYCSFVVYQICSRKMQREYATRLNDKFDAGSF
ncbi:MAG: hypothetical protein MHPSP_001078, partial [Paramarteilia canceri]